MFTPAYSEESLALADTARKFAKESIIPVAGEYDELGKMPLEVFQAAWELGLMNVELPESVGGLDVSTVEGCLIAEELAYGCAAIGTSIMCNHLGALPLMIAGSEEQEEGVAVQVGRRDVLRQLRVLGARSRIRCRFDAHQAGQGRRRLDPQR